jgi:hypothetical protein
VRCGSIAPVRPSTYHFQSSPIRHSQGPSACLKGADFVEKVFFGWSTKILKTADGLRARRREGPHRFIQKRPRTFVSALRSFTVAATSKNQLSRNFRCRSIFDFLQQYRHFSDVPGRPDYVRSLGGVKRKGKAVRSAQLTANRRQPMQMKHHARLKGGGLSFREERPWSWQQVSELSLPGLMSDNWQAGDGR